MGIVNHDLSGKAWTAWHLPAGAAAWRPVCQGDSSDSCLALALDLTEGGTVRVLPTGREPPPIPAGTGFVAFVTPIKKAGLRRLRWKRRAPHGRSGSQPEPPERGMSQA
jgi:hypothetical protein